MADFADDGDYFAVVYDKGGAALLAARDAAGPEAFDAAIRCYVDANAWRIATPDDVDAALADLPAAPSPSSTDAAGPGRGRRARAEAGRASVRRRPSSRCIRLTPSTRSSSPSA